MYAGSSAFYAKLVSQNHSAINSHKTITVTVAKIPKFKPVYTDLHK